MTQDNEPSRQKDALPLLGDLSDESRKHQSANDLFDERLGAFLGINRTDSRCLDIVSRLRRISAGQLANESGLTTGAVTAVIDRLEAKNYVRRVRDPIDRRKVWVECTEEIDELTSIIFGVYGKIGPVFRDQFTPSQLEGIRAFLRISTYVSNELAEGLRENARPGTPPAERVAQAKRFRSAIDAMAPSLIADIEKLAPRKTD
jgi:DNA-binding MarR family transcriptional regulator